VSLPSAGLHFSGIESLRYYYSPETTDPLADLHCANGECSKSAKSSVKNAFKAIVVAAIQSYKLRSFVFDYNRYLVLNMLRKKIGTVTITSVHSPH
jgi:hypothetical protein